jgi:hypothetical protein
MLPLAYKNTRRKDDGLLTSWCLQTVRQSATGTEGTFLTKREAASSSGEPEGPERLAKVVAAAFSK